MLYIPMIGVVKVHAAMIGENRKLTFEVPYFCSKNKPIRMAADSTSTTGLLTEGNGPLSPSIADSTEIAGVSIPSPMSMHIPRIAMNNNTLLAVMLRSKNFPSLLGFLATVD